MFDEGFGFGERCAFHANPACATCFFCLILDDYLAMTTEKKYRNRCLVFFSGMSKGYSTCIAVPGPGLNRAGIRWRSAWLGSAASVCLEKQNKIEISGVI
jgi:hypothetical protein